MQKKIIYYLTHPFILLRIILCRLKSIYLTKCYVTEGTGKIVITDPFLNIKIKKGNKSKFILNGNLTIEPFQMGTSPVRIILGKDSVLDIKKDFTIGNGVTISLSGGSKLEIGGRENENGSGITANSLIMVSKKISIGKDFLCAWNVFITDSDWHEIEGQNRQKDVIIEDHVWIANNSAVLKGCTIGKGSIIASNSKVSNKTIPPHSLVVGTKGDVVKSNVKWKR